MCLDTRTRIHNILCVYIGLEIKYICINLWVVAAAAIAVAAVAIVIAIAMSPALQCRHA